ncbi:MAG TPA: transglutaminase domain-containing protein [Bacteroidia bacterium]|nr:transglutaminase domain-containing protein [Bacteroidia bacterium]
MKYSSLFLLIFFFNTVLAEDNSKLAAELQAKYKDSPVAILNSDINYEFSKDPNRPLVKILEKTTEKYLSLRFNSKIVKSIVYDSNSEVVKFNGSSSMKGEVSDRDKYCGTYTNEGFFYDDSKFCSQMLNLKELGEVWTMNTTKSVNDSKYEPSFYFQESYPIVNRKVVFTIPLSIEVELKEFNFPGYSINKSESTIGGNRVVTFTVNNLDPIQDVGYKPGLQHHAPHVLILVKGIRSGTKTQNLLASVDDLYAWYHSLILKLNTRPEIFQSVVSSLIKDKKTDEDKIKSIFYWVQDNIRYIAYEDGIAGFKPDDAQNVFEKKYGDCKGMANLTKEMLKVAGYDARLTWIGTRQILYDYSIPSLAVDNHMICTVLLGGKKYFLDATEDNISIGDYAERIQNRQVMIENGDQYILDKVPVFDKSRNLEQHSYTARINGELFEGTGKVTLHGEPRKDFVTRYTHTQNDKKQEYLEATINNKKSDFKIREIKTGDLTERSGPLDIDFSFSIANSLSSFENELYIDPDPEKDFKNTLIKDDRRVDVDFGEKIYKTLNMEIETPAGYAVSSIPENLAITEPDFTFNITYSKSGNKVIYKKEISVNTGMIEKSHFENWNNAIKKLNKAYENQIVLKKK